MKVTFWGTRGSIPVATNATQFRDKMAWVLERAIAQNVKSGVDIRALLDSLPFERTGSFGGNTSCVQVSDGDQHLICDFGTGIREFGQQALAQSSTPQTFHVLLSHLHWDHIMGFPFFTPIYIPGHTIHIYSCHSQTEQILRAQHHNPTFPVEFDQLPAHIHFHPLKSGRQSTVNGFEVLPKRQIHKGGSYGYRIGKGGKSVVYTTDSEHKLDDPRYLEDVVSFFKDADLVVFDAMYSLIEAVTYKRDWGHSSNLIGVELCQRAGVKKLALFHHDPQQDDEGIAQMLSEACEFEQVTREQRRLEICAAFDGMTLDI